MTLPSHATISAFVERYAAHIVTLLCVVTMLVFLHEPYDPNTASRGLPAATAQGGGSSAASAQAPVDPAAPATGPAAADTTHTNATPAKLPPDEGRPLLRFFLALTAACTVLWGVHCHTGEAYERRTQQISFAYFVMTVSFLIFALPLVVKSQAIGTEPVGILSACVAPEGGASLLACRALPAQQECKEKPDVASALTCEQARRSANFQWVLNVGGTLSPADYAADGACKQKGSDPLCKLGSKDNRAAISGGMVVPLQFLVVALVGGAISMSRRIPEIQKRSEAEYVGTETEPRLLPCEVREKLAFQILQFVSAPLLAIVAYQIVQPDTNSTAVALAFMCGFGSEWVLLLIRGAFDSIKPRTAPMAVTKAVLAGQVRRGGLAVAGATVGLADGSRPAVTSAADGSFTLPDVPVGAVQLKAVLGREQGVASLNHTVAGSHCMIDLGLAPAITQGGPVPALPVAVAYKISVDAPGADDGSLSLTLDGVPVTLDQNGLAEVSLTAGMQHILLAGAARAGQPVSLRRPVTPTIKDDGSIEHIQL